MLILIWRVSDDAGNICSLPDIQTQFLNQESKYRLQAGYR